MKHQTKPQQAALCRDYVKEIAQSHSGASNGTCRTKNQERMLRRRWWRTTHTLAAGCESAYTIRKELKSRYDLQLRV